VKEERVGVSAEERREWKEKAKERVKESHKKSSVWKRRKMEGKIGIDGGGGRQLL
jgi:hypothetical protein